MPRITNRNDTATLDDTDDFLDGAARVRESHVRGQMHVKREAEIDGRNVPRQTAQDYVWRRPTNLDAPVARPGYKYRWVRAEFRNEGDSLNWNNRMREGWRPVDPSSIPDVALNFPVMPHANQSCIKVGGLVLMELPLERVRARQAAIRADIERQNLSVSAETEKASREGARIGAPSIQREDRVVASTGRRPSTMAD
jgi:hypothetical protein